jgi:cellulose synthase/poly-beta-1,6-N-acetylglucosamine synthase-like glycosyltransferase
MHTWRLRLATNGYNSRVRTATEVLTPEEIGKALVANGMLTAEQRDWAMRAREQAGTSLSVILVSSGLVRRQDLFRVLAEMSNVPFIDLVETPPDPGVLTGLDASQLVREGWAPVRELDDGRVLVAIARLPRSAFVASIERTLGRPAVLNFTTDWDILRALQTGLREEMLEQAAFGLWRRSAGQSARVSLYPRQRVGLVIALIVLGVCAWLWPWVTIQTVSVAIAFGFLIGVTFKFVVCMAGARRERYQAVTDADVAALRDEDLPVFTVLAPMFHEASVVHQLVANLTKLDYPVAKLEVLLLLEEDDKETISAAKAARMPAWMSIVAVPRGQPQTKPKACNVGLFLARGDYLVIYDAEDKPDPDQLKKAIVAFERGGERMVCVQAALNYWNVYENFLTRMFTAEYSFWFDYMLPGLDALHLPIPLGGTSNHFRTEGLRRLGGWDPFNVTEDADLGIRASALGYTVGVINSTTFEEANKELGNWIRQRSRWVKGYMQTSLVHARDPWSLIRVAGLRETLGFALLIAGTPLTFLFVLPLWALFVASLLVPAPVFAHLYPGWVLWIGLFNLLAGSALMIYVSMMGAFLRQRYGLVLWSLLNPVYWLLHSVAAYKALWQLITRPHYWEKTTHGISALSEADATAAAAASRPAAAPASAPAEVPPAAAGPAAGDVPRPRLPG